ncbi:ADP-ribosylglycohydrolase family protein [Enterococcus sp. BWM-S5]|uniref:ADP-ribosylglycohydrolase family protein n=1 Tax=Enterococcus larvae TaxID=2794352 RepID=A0ABS4CQ45_9ENTE|nr:ADP-ribosylglycohydrolase family protein [Enterococcus larvae]MBP1048417.1 ADP-ribosylglycohydrolase family protein [Enterococcus larvae]
MENSKSMSMKRNKKSAVNRKNQIDSVLFGFIVGDCLGVPVEFKKRGTYTVSEMTGYGTYNQPPGTWSDDTSLTLCLAENMAESGNITSLMEKFVNYRDNGYMTPFGEMFDIGVTTIEAIERFKQGIPADKCGGAGERENGNGALMRISPLVFTLQKEQDFEKRAAVVTMYSEITHAHPRSIVASLLYVELMRNMSCGHNLKDSLQLIQQEFSAHFDHEHIYMNELLNFSRIFQDDFFILSEEQIHSSGYVVDSLEAAIWCLGTTSSYDTAVLKAVNLGEDTDTIGAITGSLAGLYYTFEEIPEKWLRTIKNGPLLDNVIQKFTEWISSN